jgi:nitroimidazol reductase NimA-like FMN-containing flavoprotein (pyridoxamine 5'-phosphate oxidase superfamily)
VTHEQPTPAMPSSTTLDEPTLVDFLQRNHRAFLFCRDERRGPIGYAMRSITYESGHLYFATYTKSAKVRHLHADPEAACVVLSEVPLGEGRLSWVSLQGRAEIYRPSPEEIASMLERSSPEERVPDSVVAKVHDRLLSGKRSFIRLDVEEVRARG